MWAIFLAVVLTACAAAEEPAAILGHRCYSCHGAAKSGGLQLDSRAAALQGGKSGPAIVPGDPEHSLLFQAVSRTHERLKMPPSGKLPDAEIAALRDWIRDGAKYPETAPKTPEYKITDEQRKFWSFQPVARPEPPKVRDAKWTRTPIDAFVLAGLEASNLKPVKTADRRTLIRRATFDLTGLPPAPSDVEAFVEDKSPKAFEKVVDRLLASPSYGERQGRLWLDVARYSDDKLDSERDNPYPNAFRYRDWVIRAFNEDMPFSDFIKAQIAGDQMPASDPLKYRPGLGFYALSPEFQDDRVDATTRGFLGLTVACAQCHDHKFDPIPTKDYYSLLGVFTSSKIHETPLAPEAEVKEWQAHKKRVEDQKKAIADLVQNQSASLAEILVARTADYMTGTGAGLDPETADRWKKYLARTEREHPFLKEWTSTRSRAAAEAFQRLAIALNEEKKRIDEENKIALGLNPNRNDLSQASLKSLDRDKYVLWRELFGDNGILHYGDKKIDRFLGAAWKSRLDDLRAELARMEKELPPQYPFLQDLADQDKPHDERVQIRGSRENLGDPAPRRFLSILSPGEPARFRKGSGRLELAEAIANPENPLTARVIVNRIWQQHFGQGLVRTPSNFGQLGERPTHPELLDWLARRFIDGGWSVKQLHREIMLSATYQLSSAHDEAAFRKDPDDRLLWRFTRRRLDAESLRDALLASAGELDLNGGGPPQRITGEFRKRTVYGFVSRRRLDGYLALFDFPNPNSTSEQRASTDVPLQRLFFMNSELVAKEAGALASQLTGADAGKIQAAYMRLYSRPAAPEEVRLGVEFLKENAWPQYVQALMSAAEFSHLN